LIKDESKLWPRYNKNSTERRFRPVATILFWESELKEFKTQGRFGGEKPVNIDKGKNY
jgi:hypothetical protein